MTTDGSLSDYMELIITTANPFNFKFKGNVIMEMTKTSGKYC